MVSDKGNGTDKGPTLPAHARLPINRCNLPAVILGSLTFQHHPMPLAIDGIAELHHDLFHMLDQADDADERARVFMDYMNAHFLLDAPEDMGFSRKSRIKRHKADYLRILRGWSFDADSRDAAALKGWVESRFGLLPRHHGGPIRDSDDETYYKYLHARSEGLYNTNALEAQLDLLYTFCQYELRKTYHTQSHLRLYRGVNRLDQHDVLEKRNRREHVLLLNSVTSFTDNRHRADEFGDYILESEIPLSKILCFNRLLPGRLQGEDEFIVIGGVYEVTLLSS